MRISDKENYQKICDSISMTNLKKIINNRGYSITKVATNSKVSDSTINAYINNQKIPSVPTLIGMADFLGCNLDYLLDRTDNSININDLNKLNDKSELNDLFENIISLPEHKQELVMAYVKGLLGN